MQLGEGVPPPHCIQEQLELDTSLDSKQGCRFSVIFHSSVIFGTIRSPPIRFPFSVILYFLLFHLSLSELSVSFCVHFL